MEGPGPASALGRQRTAAAASSAPAAAPAAPSRRAAAVGAGSTRLFVLCVLRSALPPPVSHLTENGRPRPVPDVRPSQGPPGGEEASPSMLHVRPLTARFPGAGLGGRGGPSGGRGGPSALRHVCGRAGLRNRLRQGAWRASDFLWVGSGRGGSAFGSPLEAARPAILGSARGRRGPVTASLRH